MFFKDMMLKLYSRYSRSVTGFNINIHNHFIFNHLSFTVLFAQNITFAMWVKPQGTSSPESMNTYKKFLSPTSLNICKNHAHAIVCVIRIAF